MKKKRSPEVHFYEFGIDRWFQSETRLRCCLAARGAYRELIDYCYKHGSIPADLSGMSLILGCPVDELTLLWPSFSGNFFQLKSNPSRLINHHANTFRKEYFLYVAKQSRNASGKGKKSGQPKSNEVIDISNGGSTVAQPPLENPTANTIRNETKRNEDDTETKQDETETSGEPLPVVAAVLPFLKKHSEPGALTTSGWPETAASIRLFFPMTDDVLVLKIVIASIAADPAVSDKRVSEAVCALYGTEYRSAALFLSTVPKYIAGTRRGIQARAGPVVIQKSKADERMERVGQGEWTD